MSAYNIKKTTFKAKIKSRVDRLRCLIKDVSHYFNHSLHWLLVINIPILVGIAAYVADIGLSRTNFINFITILTTILAIVLLYSDFHRSWRESREKRLTALFYQKNSTGQPVVMFYYRATLGGESDIRALTQKLGSEIIKRGIGKDIDKINTRLNLNEASNHYIKIPQVLQDKKGKMVADYISIAALYDWEKDICSSDTNNKTKDIEILRKELQEGMKDNKIFFAQNGNNETEWKFTTWDEILTDIDPVIKSTIEAYGKENNLLQFSLKTGIQKSC